MGVRRVAKNIGIGFGLFFMVAMVVGLLKQASEGFPDFKLPTDAVEPDPALTIAARRNVDPARYEIQGFAGVGPSTIQRSVGWDRLVLQPDSPAGAEKQIRAKMASMKETLAPKREFSLDVWLDCSKRADHFPPSIFQTRHFAVGTILFTRSESGPWDVDRQVATILDSPQVRQYTSP